MCVHSNQVTSTNEECDYHQLKGWELFSFLTSFLSKNCFGEAA